MPYFLTVWDDTEKRRPRSCLGFAHAKVFSYTVTSSQIAHHKVVSGSFQVYLFESRLQLQASAPLTSRITQPPSSLGYAPITMFSNSEAPWNSLVHWLSWVLHVLDTIEWVIGHWQLTQSLSPHPSRDNWKAGPEHSKVLINVWCF